MTPPELPLGDHPSKSTGEPKRERLTLLERIAHGDASCVRPLIDAYGGFVWSIVLAQLPGSRHEHDAEEVVQDVFASIWKDAARYDPTKGSEKTFIAVIARRRVIDRLRKRGSDSELRTESLLEHEAHQETLLPGRNSNVEEFRIAAQAIESLAQPQRMILRLFVVSGHTHEQIAVATGVPLGTVKSHIRRGLAKVREDLRAKGLEPSWSEAEQSREPSSVREATL